jgi:(S)-ureidoglycine aminohydrolase
MVEVAPGGGSERPELDPEAEGVIFLTAGSLRITVDGTAHKLDPGGYAFVPPGTDWSVRNEGSEPAHFHWIRKAYERVDGLDAPEAFVTNERDVEPVPMPDTDGKWKTTRFVDMADLRHDMHVTIVTFEPGAVIPFAETHVMEHGRWNMGCTSSRARPSTGSTKIGSRSRRATSCGCGRSARRPATPVALDGSATCSTRTSTGT